MAALTVDVWSDVVCPWCYVGTHRLAQAVPDAEVRYHPFFLRPDLPAAGVSIPDMLRQRYGVEPAAMFARVEAEARASGQTLDLSRQAVMRPTAAAHALIDLALAEGRAAAVVPALFAAYFDDARDIADVEVLAEVGAAHGLDPARVRAHVADDAVGARVRAEASAASRRGITGVPFFVFTAGEGGLAVSGAQPVAVLRDVAAQARAGA